MRKTIALAAGIVAAQIGAGSAFGQYTVTDVSSYITEWDTLFAVITEASGDHLKLRLLQTVMSRNASTIIFAGDEVAAIVLPLTPGNTRRAVCVTSITGKEGKAVLAHRYSVFPRPDCLGSVNDYMGAAGLPIDKMNIDTVVTVRLNGDVYMDDPK